MKRDGPLRDGLPRRLTECWGHEQRKDLIEERVCPKLPRLVRDLPQGRLGRVVTSDGVMMVISEGGDRNKPSSWEEFHS